MFQGPISGDEGVAVAQAQALAAELKELLRTDAETILEFFLTDKLESEVPEIHVQIWNLLTDIEKEKILLAIPRGHAKTTLAKIAVVWYFLYTKHRFCVYASNTNAIAKNACRDIIGFIQSDNFRTVFGEAQMIKESETESLWIFQIQTTRVINGKVTPWTKKCILRAVGAGQQMRGINVDNDRPDIVVADDMEDKENTNSPPAQLALDTWVLGTFLKAFSKKTKVIWIGNMLSKTSLLARLSRRKEWNPVVFGCLVVDESTGELRPLWPHLWTIEAILEDFKFYRDLGQIETWMCEMMNMPGHGENGFRADQIKYSEDLPTSEYEAFFITIDPAFGLKRGINDKTAIVVHGIPKYGFGPTRVVTYAHGQFSEPDMFQQALRFAYEYNCWCWGIESVAAQSVLITLFNLLAINEDLHGHIEMVELYSGRGDPKVGRIVAWVNLMAKGEYSIPENDIEITTQILNYDRSKKQQADDLVDACAYGPQMLEQYRGIIIEMAERYRSGIGHNGGPPLDDGAAYGLEVAGA